MVLDIDKVCRLCLELSSNSIFQSNNSNGHPASLSDDLISRIFECTSLKVALGDGLPESICGSCLRLIDKFLLFRKMCWEADNKLREHLLNKEESNFSSLSAPVRLDDDQVNLSFEVRNNWREASDIKGEQISSDDDRNEIEIDDESDEDYLRSPSKSASKLSQPNYNCDSCAESFNKLSALKKHKKDEHSKAKRSRPVLNCQYCDKPFKQRKRYEEHVKAHESREDVEVMDNDEESNKPNNDSDSDSQAQIGKNTNDAEDQLSKTKSTDEKKKKVRKVYDCEYCDLQFNSHTKFTQHELMHTGEKKYNCSDCSRSFTHKHSLIGHIKEQHTGEVNFRCDVCGKGFVHQSTFNVHKKTHSTEKPLKCPDCGKCFTQMKNLRVHRQIHSASRTHTCQVCGKSFNFMKTLKVHLVLHSGEKPYVCSYCGKGFAQSAPLKTHTRIHTGEKPYECTLCSSSFSTNNALKSHILKHSGEAPYSCEVCNKGFGRKKDMVAHQEEAHRVFIDLPNETTNTVSVPAQSSLPVTNLIQVKKIMTVPPSVSPEVIIPDIVRPDIIRPELTVVRQMVTQVHTQSTSHELPPPLAPLSVTRVPQRSAPVRHVTHRMSTQLQRMTHRTASPLHPPAPKGIPNQPSL